MVQEKSLANSIIDICIFSILFICAAVTVLPFLFVLSSSVSQTPAFVPVDFSMSAYQFIFSTQVFLRSIGVSLYITILGTLISLFVTSLMAYAIADKELPGRKYFIMMVVFTIVFSAGMIPTFMVVRQTGMLNSLWALMIPSAISSFNLIVLKGFFQNLPEELKESARIDGCHEMRILFQIIIPLSLPAMATFGLFYAVTHWNTYFSALLYIQDSNKWPVQVLLRQIIFSVNASMGGGSEGGNVAVIAGSVKYAAIIVATVPILLIYPFLQKHFTKGVLLGSVKG
jgi:putative aldouronate transport system permease protein